MPLPENKLRENVDQAIDIIDRFTDTPAHIALESYYSTLFRIKRVLQDGTGRSSLEATNANLRAWLGIALKELNDYAVHLAVRGQTPKHWPITQLVEAEKYLINHDDIFLHTKGKKYRFLTEAIQEKTGVQQVVYQCLETGSIWVRPKQEFDSRFKKVENND